MVQGENATAGQWIQCVYEIIWCHSSTNSLLVTATYQYIYRLIFKKSRFVQEEATGLAYMKHELLKKYVIITCTYRDCNGRS
jgi:hypothetical protein